MEAIHGTLADVCGKTSVPQGRARALRRWWKFMNTSARCAPSAWMARRTASVRCRRSTASHACSSVGGISGTVPSVPTPPALPIVAARAAELRLCGPGRLKRSALGATLAHITLRPRAKQAPAAAIAHARSPQLPSAEAQP